MYIKQRTSITIFFNTTTILSSCNKTINDKLELFAQKQLDLQYSA